MKRFYLTHEPCAGHKLRKGIEPCNPKTHPGGAIHFRPFSMNWRQLMSRHRVVELFGVDLKPGEFAIVSCSIDKQGVLSQLEAAL